MQKLLKYPDDKGTWAETDGPFLNRTNLSLRLLGAAHKVSGNDAVSIPLREAGPNLQAELKIWNEAANEL